MLGEGIAEPKAIDDAFKLMFQAPLGPVQLMDRVGLDTVRNIEAHYRDELPWTPEAPMRLLEEMVEAGKLGVKTGEGFYKY